MIAPQTDGDGKLSGGRRAAAGFMAGITEALIIVTPFEVVKIRLQQQKGTDKAGLKYKARGRTAQSEGQGRGRRGAAALAWGQG